MEPPGKPVARDLLLLLTPQIWPTQKASKMSLQFRIPLNGISPNKATVASKEVTRNRARVDTNKEDTNKEVILRKEVIHRKDTEDFPNKEGTNKDMEDTLHKDTVRATPRRDTLNRDILHRDTNNSNSKGRVDLVEVPGWPWVRVPDYWVV